jgi:putative FmdB family regulatory protein
MPIYEYFCSECGLKFELLRPLSQADKEALCPQCHKNAERKFSAFSCYSKSDSGFPTPVAGAGGSCSGCSASSCDSCGL